MVITLIFTPPDGFCLIMEAKTVNGKMLVFDCLTGGQVFTVNINNILVCPNHSVYFCCLLLQGLTILTAYL